MAVHLEYALYLGYHINMDDPLLPWQGGRCMKCYSTGITLVEENLQ
jgi:hypothetical protein